MTRTRRLRLTSRRRTGSAWRLALPVLLAMLLPAAIHAQEGQVREDGRVVLTGTVTDRATGAPLSGVFIEIESLDLIVFSDKDGRFATRPIPPGTWRVEAGQLGYQLWTEERTIGPGATTLDIRLAPDPIMLEGIQVVSDRIARRRNATAVSVRAYNADVLHASAAFDARQFISSRLMVIRCPYSGFGQDCVVRRGRPVEPRVYIDEVLLLGGFDFLGLYNTNELYLIEVYNSGTQIRVYTKAFAERLAMGRVRLFPVIYD
ncbi:MAG: carboxypeptidase-like regulatory domain-containing protein [Gemmatimonadetes bacterium]|nr:carboxypeptidase-like regulatory domain-containing protein [Gemmatimonadota bacterium]